MNNKKLQCFSAITKSSLQKAHHYKWLEAKGMADAKFLHGQGHDFSFMNCR